MTNTYTDFRATRLASRFVRMFVFTLFSTLCAAVVFYGTGAEAATKKSCQNYKKHAYHSCMSAKRVRLHTRHAVVSRPQPASFLMDADTGKVLESENADAARYPASLTKMMTLYLAFEALNKGKMSLDSTIPISVHASSQPQTNIALDAGDRLAVKDAILSIVVRSANDSAVAIGEAIGGSEEGFARKMTAKARALGMKNTVFFNASGLPEPRQHTTARDMATLGLALKRDFPQYYPFFKTESFTYRGKTYTTHNHVMVRYGGVDGIKTGYIRASGFNLVTSAKKDNHNLMGVVLGGPTWRERDDKMIAMLDRNFSRLVARTNSSTQVARAELAAKTSPISTVFENSDEMTEGQGDLNIEPAAAAPRAPDMGWGVQVGAYASKSDAVKAASIAIKSAAKTLGASKVSIAERDKSNEYYRARLVNLTETDANAACKALAARQIPCFSYKN